MSYALTVAKQEIKVGADTFPQGSAWLLHHPGGRGEWCAWEVGTQTEYRLTTEAVADEFDYVCRVEEWGFRDRLGWTDNFEYLRATGQG